MSFENPWIHGLIMGLILGNVALGITGYSIWFERKFAGRMQNRPGPSVVGPWGLLQPLADVLKLMQKEDIVPRDADKALYNLAPPLTVFCALSALAVVRLDQLQAEFGEHLGVFGRLLDVAHPDPGSQGS